MRGLLLRILKRYLVARRRGARQALVVFLVADFVEPCPRTDQLGAGRGALRVEAVVATRIAPAALLLASATLVSLLRRRSELTASALASGAGVLFLPVGRRRSPRRWPSG
jgi:hypothetical protein